MRASPFASLLACIILVKWTLLHARDSTESRSTTPCHGCQESTNTKGLRHGAGSARLNGKSPRPAPFDCVSGIADMQYEWSLHKQQWCCRHRGFGCSTVTLSTSMSSTTLTTTLTIDPGLLLSTTQILTRPSTEIGTSRHRNTMRHTTITTGSIEQGASKLSSTSTATTLADSGVRTHTTTSMQANRSSGVGKANFTSLSTTMATTLATSALNAHARTSTQAHRSDCFEEDVSWEPLSMPNTMPVEEKTAKSCQLRCSQTPDCMHFSYFRAGKMCYLQDELANRQASWAGFVSGPFQCWNNVNHLAFIEAGENSYLPISFKCMALHTLYSPIMGAPRYILNGSNGEAAVACQTWCASDPACDHWTMQFPQRLCRLAAPGAHELSLQNAVSGSPTKCNDTDAAVVEDGDNASVNSTIIIRADASTGLIAKGYYSILLLVSSVVIAVAFLSSVVLRRASTGSRFVRNRLEEPMTHQSTSEKEEAMRLTNGATNWTPEDDGVPGPCRWMRKPQFFGREVNAKVSI